MVLQFAWLVVVAHIKYTWLNKKVDKWNNGWNQGKGKRERDCETIYFNLQWWPHIFVFNRVKITKTLTHTSTNAATSHQNAQLKILTYVVMGKDFRSIIVSSQDTMYINHYAGKVQNSFLDIFIFAFLYLATSK